MAEEAAAQVQTDTNPDSVEPATDNMDLEAVADPKNGAAASDDSNGVANGKREREEDKGEGGDVDEVSKKAKVEKSVEEERLEKEAPSGVKLWAKEFESSVEMFNYFHNLLQTWLPNIDINKYEHMMLLELLTKGHPEKIGLGVKAFQIRYHPLFKSKCFFLLREDDSVDDFSFRKCVDHILPLPEDMKAKLDTNRGGGGKGNGGRGGRGRGRGGKGRH